MRSLVGTINREAGHPSYQHPARSQVHYGFNVDRFAALVIYTAIRALAVAPQIWFRLDDGDNLLFRREDFINPFNSRAFTVLIDALRNFPAERELVLLLRQACAATPTSASPLKDL